MRIDTTRRTTERPDPHECTRCGADCSLRVMIELPTALLCTKCYLAAEGSFLHDMTPHVEEIVADLTGIIRDKLLTRPPVSGAQ